MSLIALGCLKQVIFFQLFPTIFIEKKNSHILYSDHAFPSPTSPRSSPLTHLHSLSLFTEQNPRNTHTNAHKNTSENKQADDQ